MTNRSVCRNPYCKAPYFFEGDMPPGECPKCANPSTEITSFDGVVRTNKPEKPSSDKSSHLQFSSNVIDSNTKYAYK
jgi:hypothetical protein